MLELSGDLDVDSVDMFYPKVTSDVLEIILVVRGRRP